MVCSQVYSQHPSQNVPANAQQHRYWDPNNAEVYCLEPEISEGNWWGHAVRDGNLWPSKVNACSGPANTPSTFKSSWIQRLIPSHGTRAEQPQITENLISESRGMDGVRIDWKENATYPPLTGFQSDFPLYENSRNSKQDFFSGHQTFLGSDTTRGALNGVNITATSRQFEPSEAMQSEVQVLPKPLPIVESLLLGSSKRIFDNQIATETNKPHILSNGTRFSNQRNQTVHYSADERSRVSCSSIQGLNSRSAVCAAKDLLAFKSMQGGKSCFNPSQPNLEFPLNSADAVTMSNMDSVYAGKDWRTSTNLSRTYMNPPHIEDPFTNLHTEDRYPVSHADWASSVARCKSTENRLVDGHSMPYRAEDIKPFTECFAQANHSTSKTDERLHIGFSMDQPTLPKTIGNRDCWHVMEHRKYEVGDSFTVEALNAKGGAFDGGGGGLLVPNMRKDGLQRVSDLGFSHYGENVAKERASISLSYHMKEQELSSTHDSHEEQGGMSRSFSFEFANGLSYDPDHARFVMGKGHWPFCPITRSSEDLVQSRWPADSRARDTAEATRLGISLKDSATFQEIGVHEAGMVCISRSRCSPFFGSENLTESARHGLSVKDDNSPYKASCIDIKEAVLGEMNTESLRGNGVAQAGGIEKGKARSLKGGHIFSRSESDLMIDVPEWKELKSLHPFRTVSVDNWNPSTRSTIHTFLPVGAAQLKQADGNLCYSTGSIGSCSKRSANLCTENTSTSVEARCRHTSHERPEALTPAAVKRHLHSFETQSASNGLNVVRDGQGYEGREAVGWEGSCVNQNMWLRRWSTTRSSEGLAICKSNGERTGFAGMGHTRKGFSTTSQGSKESSHRFDLRPAKRICYEERMSDEPGKAISKFSSIAMGRKHSRSGVSSHFMKRFFTPSAAAMAVMGMTARKVHATQPQGRGLFGRVWALNASIRKPPAAPAEMCKKFSSIDKTELRK